MKLEDIAKLANVSKATVSLALNNKPGISEGTRANILRIAQEYEYTPLRKHKPKNIDGSGRLKIRFVACTNEDVISENYEQQPFFNELLSYLSMEMSAKHHSLITNKLSKQNFLEELIALEKNEASDGIIFLGTNLTSAHITPLSERFSKLVILDTLCGNANCNIVTMNNYLGAYESTKHLLEMGHYKIGYAKGTPRINNFYDRQRGFNDALLHYKIDPDTIPKLHVSGMRIGIIEKDISQLSKFVDSVTAVFCENDYIALSLIKTLNKHGIHVPKDLSVIGFDDISESRATVPELTTIHVPIKEIAQEAVALIELEATTEMKIKKQIFLNTQLVIRESVEKFSKASK